MENIIYPNNKSASPLVDIRDVSVDPSLPKEKRVDEFVRQVRNPYRFRCGTFKVAAKFLPDTPSLEDCLSRLMAA